MQYEHFRVEDFVLDEAFSDWVQRPTPENQTFWTSWLLTHPHKAAEVEEARRIILGIDFPEDLTPGEKDEVWQHVESVTGQGQAKVPNRSVPLQKRWRSIPHWYQVAAAVTVLLAATGLLYLWVANQRAVQTYQTAYGEIRRVHLPDGSVAVLNANSSLRYRRAWLEHGTREVWLDGEAFFSVTKQNKPGPTGSRPVKFLVHTSHLDVQVLGTRFNVQDRAEQTKVTLNEGKVKVTIPLPASATREVQEITMQPGELVAFSEQDRKVTRQRVNPAVYSAWTGRKYILQQTPLREIIATLEHNYGVRVVVEDSTLLDQTLTGTVVSSNLDALLNTLATAADMDIQKEGNRVIFRRKEE